jgi:hypothetical protein
MPARRNILDEDDRFREFKKRAIRDQPGMIAVLGRAMEDTLDGLDDMKDQFVLHCQTPSDKAHPLPCKDGNCNEDDVSNEAPKEGTIFFKGKVSGKWVERIILILITVGGTYGLLKIMGV